MSFSPQSNSFLDYGFAPDEEEKEEEKKKEDPYEKLGFTTDENPKKKGTDNNAQSILYGLIEGVLGPVHAAEVLTGKMADLAEKSAVGQGIKKIAEFVGIPEMNEAVQGGVNKLKDLTGLGDVNMSPIGKSGKILEALPESTTEEGRRLRVGASSVIGGAPFGIPGIIMGLIGSQAGQTVREVYGKEGKFDELGWGEGVAIGADLLTGLGVGIGSSLARSSRLAAQSQIPRIFTEPRSLLNRVSIKSTIQGERNALEGIINAFGTQQVSEFEQQAARISPNRYTQLNNSTASEIQQTTNNMMRQGQLRVISPLVLTPEQGGTAIQQAANTIFDTNVIAGERQAYLGASQAAEGLSGQAPRTVEQAKTLLDDIIRITPNPEQDPMVSYLRGLIADLEGTTPASSLLDASGNPISQAATGPRTRSANDLIGLIQNGNHAVNYDSTFREQSHRLAPIIQTLRTEVGAILDQNPQARTLYQQANALHANNAQVWGTNFMRNVRFTENPESIVSATSKASNMRNFKLAVDDPAILGIAERLVIDNMTQKGSAQSNRIALDNISPELSPQAIEVGNNLISGKDPLTIPGGWNAVRNQILTDAAQSVNTGKRPEQILTLMQTLKGYQLVREALNATPESRALFNSMERLFVEDIFSSVLNKNGEIDFSKARNIFKNPEVRQVVNEIGGDNLVNRFSQLENYSNNLSSNLELFKRPETQSIFKRVVSKAKTASIMAAVLNALHVPLPIIAGLGLVQGAGNIGKVAFSGIKDKILQNPRAMRALEAISIANSIEELSKQLPRLIKEIEIDEE